MSVDEVMRQALESERDALRLFLENQGLKVVLTQTVRALSHDKQQTLLAWLQEACAGEEPMPGMEEALQIVVQNASPSSSVQ